MPNKTIKLKTKAAVRSKILLDKKYESGKETLDQVPWEKMNGATQTALVHLLNGQKELKQRYEKHLDEIKNTTTEHRMTFALDGRLVGDIGELIAAEIFPLNLLGTKSSKVDAVTECEPMKRVQIKATFGGDSLSIKHGKDSLIAVQLNSDGSFRVVYNGHADRVMKYLKLPESVGKKGRKGAGKKLEPLSLSSWALLDLEVPAEERIQRRKQTSTSP